MTAMTPDRERFLSDIVVGFTEDFGTNSWRQIKGGTDQPDAGAVTFIDREDEDKEYAVTIDIVARGISRLIDGEVGMNKDMLANIGQADDENDAGQIDAYDADLIVQAGVFGELVYG